MVEFNHGAATVPGPEMHRTGRYKNPNCLTPL